MLPINFKDLAAEHGVRKGIRMKKPKLQDFKREVYDGQDYADWYKEYYQALEKYVDELEQALRIHVSNCYTFQDMIDAYDAGVWNPNDETAKEYMKREYNVC